MKLASKIFLGSALEQAVLVVAAGSFARYEAAVEEERRLLKRRQRAEAIRLGETEARSLADQVGQSLEDLVAATHRGAEEARAEAALLEQRTWTGVLVALGCALGLGLGATAVLANRLTRRLRVLSEATAAVAAGSFREPIPERGADEIAALPTASMPWPPTCASSTSSRSPSWPRCPTSCARR